MYGRKEGSFLVNRGVNRPVQVNPYCAPARTMPALSLKCISANATYLPLLEKDGCWGGGALAFREVRESPHARRISRQANCAPAESGSVGVGLASLDVRRRRPSRRV